MKIWTIVHQRSHRKEGVWVGLLLDSDSTTPNLLPEIVIPFPSKSSWGNEEILVRGAHHDISNPDAEKPDCFFAFLQEKLKWTKREPFFDNFFHPEGLLNLKALLVCFESSNTSALAGNALKIIIGNTN